MQAVDLSRFQGLVSELFKWPESKSDWEEYRLTKEQVGLFRENGWLAGVPMLDDKQIQALRKELTSLADQDHPGH